MPWLGRRIPSADRYAQRTTKVPSSFCSRSQPSVYVDLDDEGDVADDQLRDRRSSGTSSNDNAGNKGVQRH